MSDPLAYQPPVGLSFHAPLAFLLLTAGFLLTAAFFSFQGKSSSNVFRELSLAMVASLFLGFGTLFLFLSVGLYV
jgi:hypothetical protein